MSGGHKHSHSSIVHAPSVLENSELPPSLPPALNIYSVRQTLHQVLTDYMASKGHLSAFPLFLGSEIILL